MENWEPTSRCRLWRFQPSSRQLRIWSTYCPCGNKWMWFIHVRLNLQSRWRTTNNGVFKMSAKLNARFLQSFTLRMSLPDRVSESFWIDVLNHLGYKFWKEFQFFFWWPEDLLCHAYVCMLACPFLPCAATHTSYISCVHIAEYKYASRCATQSVSSGQSHTNAH